MTGVESGTRARVADVYEAALDRAFGDDPAVYVLRRVHTELTITNPSLAGEAAMARQWAAKTCAAVVTTVTRNGHDSSMVMRFDDTPDFVAHFLADLLDGRAWDRWYYGAFSIYQSMSVDDALRSVLLDFGRHLAAILRRLMALGRWHAALARIPTASARELWLTVVRDLPEAASQEQFRPLVRAAMSIAGALELWARETPEENALLGEYCDSSPQPPDWKQTRGLAEAVFAVFVFLDRRELLAIRQPVAVKAEAVAQLEWLDRQWLAAAIEAFVRGQAVPSPDSVALSAARPPAMTALQRRIIEVLEELLATGAVTLPDAEVTSACNALALFAALASAEPLLALHPAGPAVITWFLRSRARVESARSSLVAETASAGHDAAPSHTTALAARAIESHFAGIALLTRVLIEARVPQLAAALGATPGSVVLLALAVEWTGEPDPDEGLRFWSGFDGTALEAREQMAQLDPGACAALRDAIQRLMRDRAAFAPSLVTDADPLVAPLPAIASDLVRLWAHWLPGVGRSGVPWLLRQFVLRRGVFRTDGASVTVALAPAGLDVVLEMAGYLRPIAAVPWLADRRITFEIDRRLT